MVSQADIDNIAYSIAHGDQHSINGINYGSGLPFLDYIVKSFQNIYGRTPTVNEVTQSAPYFQQSGIAGDAYVSQLFQDQQNDPIAQKKKFEGQSGQYSGQINDLTNELYKRGATPDEVKHFGGLLASGQVDPYELRSFIQATPEYQANQDTAFRSQVGGELADLDTKAFGRQKEDVISRFASAGRLGSSALDFALTDLMGKVAEKRQGFLANLSANQYQGNKETARADYGNVLNGMQDTTSYERDLNNTYRTRGWNVQDYNTQRDDWMRALKESQKKPNWMDYTSFGLNALNSVINTGKNVAVAGGTGGANWWGPTA